MSIWEQSILLKVEGLNVYYDQFHVIQDLSLEVLAGEAVGLVGPNGHGKSTLLKAICGLLPIASGKVSFKGEQINGRSAPDLVQRGLVYVAEDRRLFPEMTVRENLMLGAYLSRGQERKDENLRLVFGLYPRLKEREDQLANTLSGGEAQMLALGRGLMSAADFMAIDEPSFGLAPNLVRTMLDTIESIKKSGITIMLVEQNTSQLEKFIDRVYVLEEGKNASETSIEALRQQATRV
jgi:branched-chain amino acid transport system ATP-binding protein